MTHIGILGGTFDPIHHGHLFSAETAAAAFELERVLLVPAGQNPLKRQTQTAAAHRVQMARLAAAANPLLQVTTVDVDRAPPSYTVDTMALLAGQYPGAALYLILGADALSELPDWREPRRLLGLCHVIVLSRPGYPLALPPDVRTALGGAADRIHLQEMPALEISSTDLRRRFRVGEPVRYLLPEAVERYVREQRLYSAKEAKTL